MARCMVVFAFLVITALAGLQTGFAQTTPDSRRQLNQDIQNQQRQIQERSREIEQRVQDQQREEERYRREQDERRRREEWIEQQRQNGQPVIDISRATGAILSGCLVPVNTSPSVWRPRGRAAAL